MSAHPLQMFKFRIRFSLVRLLNKMGFSPEVHYIGSNEVLPPPLSAEEEKELLVRLQDGDLKVRTPLIERNLRLVVYIARKFENTGISTEDLVSIGTIGLIKAVNTFDPSKNIKLATYASRCIENEILMYLRRTSKLKSEVSFDEPLNVDWDGNELVLADVVGIESDIIVHIEKEVDRALLLTALRQLSGREKKIMELRFGLNTEQEKTQREVAELLGIYQSYISRLEKKILKKLEREIKKME